MEKKRERDQLGKFLIGHRNIGGFGRGSEHTKESKALISLSLIGKYGEDSRRWKGDGASYQAKHMWIRKHYGDARKCENPTKQEEVRGFDREWC